MFRRCVIVLGVLGLAFSGVESASAGASLGTLEATYSFHASDFCADPQRPYVYATAGSQLEIINTATLAVATVPLPGTSSGMAMSLDGSKLYVAGQNGVYVMDAQTQTLLPSLNFGLLRVECRSGAREPPLRVDRRAMGHDRPGRCDFWGFSRSERAGWRLQWQSSDQSRRQDALLCNLWALARKPVSDRRVNHHAQRGLEQC